MYNVFLQHFHLFKSCSDNTNVTVRRAIDFELRVNNNVVGEGKYRIASMFAQIEDSTVPAGIYLKN